jgi:hypothetical protein
MTDIDKMNLAECISVVRRLTPDELEYDVQWRVGARIEKLTRWIPVSERKPEAGEWVLAWMSDGAFEAVHESYLEQDSSITHWKRITPPEDK